MIAVLECREVSRKWLGLGLGLGVHVVKFVVSMVRMDFAAEVMGTTE